jgi:hypothetical protein
MPRAAPPAPPNTPKSCRTDQGPNRDAAAAAGPEQTGLADRAPAAGSAAAAGSPQAARTHVRAAVSDPDCSWPAPGRPSGSGAAGAMSRVGEALWVARWRLREARRAPRVAGCLPVLWPLCPADVGQPLLVHHESRRVGPADHFGGVESRFLHPAKMVRSASSAGCMGAGRGRSILGTVSLHHSISIIVWPWPPSRSAGGRPLAAQACRRRSASGAPYRWRNGLL